MKLLMEMMACGNEHWIWKDGCPQPGYDENGKDGMEVKGGHDKDLVFVEGGVEQLWGAAEVVKGRRSRKRKVAAALVLAECGGISGGGGDDMVEMNL